MTPAVGAHLLAFVKKDAPLSQKSQLPKYLHDDYADRENGTTHCYQTLMTIAL